MVSGSLYFLGKWRPAYFEAPTIAACRAKMAAAVLNVESDGLRAWFFARLHEGEMQISRPRCDAWSADHCDRGVSFAKRPHDRFLDSVTLAMSPCPGLDYTGACNAS